METLSNNWFRNGAFAYAAYFTSIFIFASGAWAIGNYRAVKVTNEATEAKLQNEYQSAAMYTARLENLEGRIALTERKAYLTSGKSCILNEEVLNDESLAIQMTRACLRAYAVQGVENK
jgi:hypothetical protein